MMILELMATAKEEDAADLKFEINGLRDTI